MAAGMGLDSTGWRTMFSHCWSVRASPLRKAPRGALSRAILLTVLAVLVAGGSAHGAAGIRADKTGEVDTEHMFGFTEGSDIGEAGEKELEADSTGRFGKFGGSYNNVATALEAKYSFSDRFRLSAVATVAYYDITGVNAIDDRRQGALQSVSFDARFRLLDREHAPFGLTLSVEPHRGFADEMSGEPGDQYGAEFRVLADRELIPGRLFAALNVSYEPEQTRLRGSGETLRESTLGIGAALAMQVMPNVFIGAEARNLRHFDGLGLNGFAGQALYIGPTFYATFGERYFVSAAWNVQVWGAVAGTSGVLDLDNFERHHVKLRIGARF
jgi:hypothetical protein